MKILLLEPNRLLAEQYRTYLSAQGHTVVWREDAQSGVNAADEISPDVVVVELLLAGHSGVEFLYEFRSYSDWESVPAIVLSTSPQESMGIPDSTLKELGVTAYLYKPETSLARLCQVIEHVTAHPKKS